MPARRNKAAEGARRHRAATVALAITILLLPIAGANALHGATAAAHRRAMPVPRIRHRPPVRTTQFSAYFTYNDRLRGVRFQCSLDHGRFKACGRAVRYGPHTVRTLCPKIRTRRTRRCRPKTRHVGRPLRVGRHSFRVRAVTAAGHRSRPAAYSWTIYTPPAPEGLPFTITTSGTGEPLYPGGPPEDVPLTLHNPNSAALYVTALTVTVSKSSAGCEAAQNLLLRQSSASPESPVVVPPDGSVTLPVAGVTAPTVQMLELPVNQDQCKGASFTFSYSGSGHS